MKQYVSLVIFLGMRTDFGLLDRQTLLKNTAHLFLILCALFNYGMTLWNEFTVIVALWFNNTISHVSFFLYEIALLDWDVA